MEIVYTQKAQEHITYWKSTGNKLIMSKISKLIDAIEKDPYEGIGKPEALKFELTGLWSRRINQQHRIVYQVEPDRIIILSLKGHY